MGRASLSVNRTIWNRVVFYLPKVARIMCQVDSFFCGCRDLRKGTLIIGVIELVFSIIHALWTGVAIFRWVGWLGVQEVNQTTVLVTLIVLGVLEVILIISVIINALLVQAANGSKPGSGHTLPWMIVTMIGIVFKVLAIVGGNYQFVLDVALSIYFFIVVKSYRAQLLEGGQAGV